MILNHLSNSDTSKTIHILPVVTVLEENLWSNYGKGVGDDDKIHDFFSVFGVFFPAVTGKYNPLLEYQYIMMLIIILSHLTTNITCFRYRGRCQFVR